MGAGPVGAASLMAGSLWRGGAPEMSVLKSQIKPRSPNFQANAAALDAFLAKPPAAWVTQG